MHGQLGSAARCKVALACIVHLSQHCRREYMHKRGVYYTHRAPFLLLDIRPDRNGKADDMQIRILHPALLRVMSKVDVVSHVQS